MIVYGQNQVDHKLDPVIKSLIIPGWGQKSLEKPKRARFFNYLESGILTYTNWFFNFCKY